MLDAPAKRFVPLARRRLHELDGEPVEQFGMRWAFALRAEILAGGDQPGAEIRLPNAVDESAGRRGRAAVGQPAGEGQPVARRVSGKLMQHAGTPGPTLSAGLEEIAAVEQVRFARHVALLREPVAMSRADVLPRAVRSCRSRLSIPATVVRQKLKIASSSAGVRARGGSGFATACGSGSASAFGSSVTEKRKRPRLLFWLSSLFQPPCSLHQLERQRWSLGEIDRLVEDENRLARHVAAARADVDGPGRFVLAVDGERDRPGDSALVAAIVENRFEFLLATG